MSLPIGIVCEKCGQTVGSVIAPASDKLIPLDLKFACLPCINTTCAELGISGSSEESWAKIAARLRRPAR